MGGHDCGSALPRKWVQGAVAGTHQGISHCWCCYPRCGSQKNGCRLWSRCDFCLLLRRVLRVLDPVRVVRANKASAQNDATLRARLLVWSAFCQQRVVESRRRWCASTDGSGASDRPIHRYREIVKKCLKLPSNFDCSMPDDSDHSCAALLNTNNRTVLQLYHGSTGAIMFRSGPPLAGKFNAKSNRARARVSTSERVAM